MKTSRLYEKGEECSPSCRAHLSHPCENCGRYAAGMLNAPPPSEEVFNRVFSEAIEDIRTRDIPLKAIRFKWTHEQMYIALCMRLLHEDKNAKIYKENPISIFSP